MAAQSKTANKTAIDLQITTNGNNEITGADLNAILDNIVDSYEDFIGSYTTVQIAALVGMTLRQRVFNTTDNDYEYYDGTRWVKEAHPKYKLYTALLTQTSTNAPVATVLENTLGGTVVWSYDDVGQYIGTLNSAFTANKTIIFIGSPPGGYALLHGFYNDTDTVMVQSIVQNQAGDKDLELANALLSQSVIEIRVYY